MAEVVRNKARSFLQIQPGTGITVNISEMLDFEGNAIKNRIWYRGDSQEIQQLYTQLPAPSTMFWKASSSVGMRIRKAHTGLPGIIVDTLTWIVISDINQICVSDKREDLWNSIDKENKIKKILGKAVSDTLIIGDGAFKISIDSEISKLPIIEWYPGNKIEFVRRRGRIYEIIFKTPYFEGKKEYSLRERYGYGYVDYTLMFGEKEVPLDTLEATKKLQKVTFSDDFMMAYPLMFFESGKYEGRGKSIFDGKIDAFDCLDEAWSQWMHALRLGRTREYIPEDMLPRNSETGEVMPPNDFDFQYISTESPNQEDVNKKIILNQPSIPHESYLSTYSTALDQALEGLISPSTLGIDVKKLDNAESQREKEKVTLYTRNKVVDALQETLPDLIRGIFATYDTMNRKPLQMEEEIDVTFGEYANPSFESQIETVSKGKTNGIMSIETCVDELYGDSRDDEWKEDEVKRLKEEQGIYEMEEPATGLEGDIQSEGKSIEPVIPNEQERI